ncbi:MAG: hypothetical protein JWO27_1990 [Frankiales bacterium]|nr:hypothetical protein [Frankiales bacterium]
MPFHPARLVAGTLVLALPLAAAAGCGAVKKRSIKQELTSARSHLADSSAASFTLRLEDKQGSLAALAKKSGDVPDAAVKDLLGGSVTYTFDAKSAQQLKGVDPSSSTAELKKALAGVRFALAVKDAKATVAELRLVDSTLFARVDIAEIDRVAKEAGSDGVAASFDDAIASAPAEYRPALRDLKAGKWLKLPLAGYLAKLKDAVGSLPTPSPGKSGDLQKTRDDLMTALKPYVSVTDANDSSSKRVLDVNVAARPALKAALAVLKRSKGLPFASALQDVQASAIDKNIADGKVHGTITLADGHLTQVSLDLESIRALDPHKSSDSLAGSSVVVDVDDSADQVTAPADGVSSVDVKALVDDLFKNLSQGLSGRVSMGVSS